MKVTRLPDLAIAASLFGGLFVCSLPAHSAKLHYSIVAGSDEVCKLAQEFLNSGKTKPPAGFKLLGQAQTPVNAKLPGPAQGDQLQKMEWNHMGVMDSVGFVVCIMPQVEI